MRKLILSLGILLCSGTSFSQVYHVLWEKSFGGSSSDLFRKIQKTSDGNYIVAGHTKSDDGDGVSNHGVPSTADFLLVNINNSGVLNWRRCFGGSSNEYAYDVKQATDNGYFITGYTTSNDGQVTGYHGAQDMWVVRTDADGVILWEKCIGGSSADLGTSICATADGGCLVGGLTNSKDGDITDTVGSFWVVKLAASGNIEWQRNLGSTDNDVAYDVLQKSNGHYIVAGYTASVDAEATSHGEQDGWVLELDDTGAVVWGKTYGGSKNDLFYTIKPALGGGYYVGGSAQSTDGHVTGNHGGTINGAGDAWLVKIDDTGSIVWQKPYGGSKDESITGIDISTDSTVFVAAWTNSTNGDVSFKKDSTDYWRLIIDKNGNIENEKTVGGSSYEVANGIVATEDKSCIMVGYTNSTNGDISTPLGGLDGWVVKIAIDESVGEPGASLQPLVYPQPCHQQLHITLQDFSGKAEVRITDITGRCVYSTNSTTAGITIATDKLENGIYQLYIATNTAHSVQTISIMH